MSVQACEQLTLYPEASLASRSVLPGSEEARRMTATSGLKCLELSRSSGPLGSLVRTLLGSSAWFHPARLLEWRAEALISTKTKYIMRQHGFDRKRCCSWNSSEALNELVTRSRHLLYRLVPSEPPTGGTESPLWPTATTPRPHDNENSAGRYIPSQKQKDLAWAVAMWPTPKASDAIMGMTARTSGRPLEKSTHLQAQVYVREMFPTPKATDFKGSGPPGSKSAEHDQEHGNLKGYVMYPTPKVQNARGGGQKHGDGGPSLDVAVGGQLNPSWVEWLMGFPPGWTDIG